MNPANGANKTASMKEFLSAPPDQIPNQLRVLTNLAKWNSTSFPDPLNSLFHTIIMLKPDVTNHLTSHFGTFLALMQNYRIYV